MWRTVCVFTSTILCLLFALTYVRFRRTYRLWPRQGVPTLPATFPAGNLDLRMAHTNFGLIAIEFYAKLKRTGDYAGLFFLNKPVLLVLSPKFAKIVLTRDFKYFTNRGVYFNKENDPLSANLFFIENHDWRKLRIKMTPTFTSGKIKTMFPTMYEVGAELRRHMDVRCDGTSVGGIDIEITDVMARYNTDIIVSCAFGMQCNSLFDANSEFRAVGKKMLAFDRMRLYKLYGAMLFRRAARAMGFRLLHEDVSKFIIAMCRQTIDQRREKQIKRKDFMQLMIDMYDDGRDETNQEGHSLTLEEIAANVFLFFFAGFETSSTAMTYTLFELAQNHDIQSRVRREINDICGKYNNEVTYEALMEMPLLDRVIYETMRMHPAVGTLHRVVEQDYTLPNGGVAPKGTYVIVPAVAFHNDPEIFSNPEKFDPDRFTEENKAQRHPYAYLPFGEGPRICTGIRFGMLQTKLGLALMLRHFAFDVCAKTTIPLKIDHCSLLMLPHGGVWLNMRKVDPNLS